MARRSEFWLAALIILLGSAPTSAAELSLKRVALSTGGVGYFEYEAEVQGDASLSLDVALDQVDDVLKSLVVYDSAGTAGEITLPGREPQAKILSGTPFEGTANSLADLLNKLLGAELRIAAPTPERHSVFGRIGRGTKPPPQFGQTLDSTFSTHSAQNVHS